MLLPPGDYTVKCTRGPEYLVETRHDHGPEAGHGTPRSFELKRWIHLAKKGWFSRRPSRPRRRLRHYESPTEGVTPEDMMRHILGEDLDVGCVPELGAVLVSPEALLRGQASTRSRRPNT